MKETLVARGLQKSYGARQVVHDVSLEVECGEVVGLLGPNGAGKTTSFYMIVGLVPSDEGEIQLGGVPISRLPIHRRATLGLSYLPQEASVFRKLSVADGSVAWSTAITKLPVREKIASSLNFFNGRVIATTGGYNGDIPPYQGHVALLDADSGALLHVWNTLCSNQHALINPSTCPQTDAAIWGRAGAVVDTATGNLYVASGIAKMGITELTIAVWPWLLTMLVFLGLVTYIPAISLAFPRWLGMVP